MNAHKLFLGSRQVPAFHQAISPCSIEHAKLVDANKKIRNRIRAAAKEIKNSKTQLASLSVRNYLKDHGEPIFDVRFLWQGSKVYKTDVDPAQKPPQKTDLDDGIYLRTSFFDGANPAISSEMFFRFIENALKGLCDENGWELITNKDTCVCVIIGKALKIDLPLYSIPDKEFEELQKATMRSFGIDISIHGNKMLNIFDAEPSLRIASDRVMLAHRKKGWISSDPKALQDWFDEKALEFGPQLKRICRYLKGWRDYTFAKGGPESITLMVCAVIVFEEMFDQINSERDDEAFLTVAKQLPTLFQGDIENPTLLGREYRLNKWTEEERTIYLKEARELYSHVEKALNGTQNQQVTIDKFIAILGERFPIRPDLVKVELETKSEMTKPFIIQSAIKPAASTTSG